MPSTSRSPSGVTTRCSGWTIRTSNRCSPRPNAQVDALVQHPSISADVARKILCENAARLYGFDLAQLAPDIERVGFEVDGSAGPGRR